MRIKRLYLFLIKSFIGTFLATFFICLFVVLMQFLWKYVDEMVGKGLSIAVLGEFFYYAALSLVPMALPLAILLASIMTFGNFGERLELLAMKAAGISLFRIMRPYLVFITFISVGAFFFSNNMMPKIQIKLYTLLISMRQKTPDVDIPEGSFYNKISGYNVYVRHKNQEKGLMEDLMIYDFSKGFDNAIIMAADSGRLLVSEDKKNLILDLYSGESFENLKEQKSSTKNVPYRRETFSFKEILIEYDSNFKMADDGIASSKYMSKNLSQLTGTIDSLSVVLDSINTTNKMEFKGKIFNRTSYDFTPVTRFNLESYKDYDYNKAFDTLPKFVRLDILKSALREVKNITSGMQFQKGQQYEITKSIRKHDIERHRKFTLSLCCIIFFFIGAPLGAIIRKGGIGMPIVISVLLFVFYYVIDNWGYKMAREGIWHIWAGIWLSSAVLFPLGVFLTYQAATDRFISISEIVLKFRKYLLYKCSKVTKQEIEDNDDIKKFEGTEEIKNKKIKKI